MEDAVAVEVLQTSSQRQASAWFSLPQTAPSPLLDAVHQRPARSKLRHHACVVRNDTYTEEVDDLVTPELVQHHDLLGELRHRLVTRRDLIHSLDGDVVPAEFPKEDNPKAPLGWLTLHVELCVVQLRRDDRPELEPELECRLRVALHATLSEPTACPRRTCTSA